MSEKRVCVGQFERKPKGLRYVTARWKCKRTALIGSMYCWYCEPLWEKEKRRASRTQHTVTQEGK